MTREEIYESDRGERAYYEKTRDPKVSMKLPITRDGIESILEQVTSSMDIPLDDTIRQVFCGHVHHLPTTENSLSFETVMRVLHKHMANHATYLMDQETKEKRRRDDEAAKLATNGSTPLTLAKDANAGDGTDVEQPGVQ